jgi:excisionase family DNA binding protein
MDERPLLMTYERAARQLSASKRTVQRLVTSGEVPAMDVAGCRRIRTATSRLVGVRPVVAQGQRCRHRRRPSHTSCGHELQRVVVHPGAVFV